MTGIYIFSPLCFLTQRGQSLHIFTWSFFIPFLVSQSCSSFYLFTSCLKTIKQPLCHPLILHSSLTESSHLPMADESSWGQSPKVTTLCSEHSRAPIPSLPRPLCSAGAQAAGTLLLGGRITFTLGLGQPCWVTFQSEHSQAVGVSAGTETRTWLPEKLWASCVVDLELGSLGFHSYQKLILKVI